MSKDQFQQNVFALHINQSDESAELTPSNIKYDGKMNNGLLLLTIKLDYINENDFPDNKAVLFLPLQNFQMLYEINCYIDNKPIQLDIHEILEEQRKQIYATGQNVISLGYQYFKINIGTLQKGSTCNFEIKMNIISTNTDERTYRTIIPNSKLDPKNNFSFKIIYSNETNVSNAILVGNDSDIENIDYDFEFNTFVIEQNPPIPIIIDTELINTIANVIQSGMNDEYFIISILPQFSDISKLPSNDFIFITDCSGSMSGDRVRNASNCLLTFLKSLPVDCKFNIIRFGTDYESIFNEGKLVDNNEENINKANEIVANMNANMGGTNLYGPLQEAYKQSETSKNEGKIVQIFTLTDGGISDRDQVFQLVEKHKQTHHINSIGVGAGVSNELVEGLAKHSNGSYDFVTNASDTKKVVMELMNKSQKPECVNPSIKIYGENGEVFLEPKINEKVRYGQMMNFVVKKNDSNRKNFKISNIEFTGTIENKKMTAITGELNVKTPIYSEPIKPTPTPRPTPPTPKPTLNKPLEWIIKLQSYDGKWNGKYIDTLKEFLQESYNNDDNFDEKLNDIFSSIDKDLQNDISYKEDIRSTIIAICILNVQYRSEKSNWELIQNKAIRWLTLHHIKRIYNIISLFTTQNDCNIIYNENNDDNHKKQYNGNHNKKPCDTDEDNSIEPDNYDGYQYKFLYITDHNHNMSEAELRNTFARFNIKCQILQDRCNMNYALVTLPSYTDTKEFIRASLNTSYYVSFQDESIRYGLHKNYKYKLYKKKPNISFINKSQYQARAALNDPYFISNYLK